MVQATVGRTGLRVNKDALGALPLQRTALPEAEKLLQRALEKGITFFDTARAYTDSEEKIGRALSDKRTRFVLATKTTAKTGAELEKDLETSLQKLKTDYIDLYQLHNPESCPKPGDGSLLYEALLAAKKQGKIRFIGITNHRLPVAREAVESGLYDTLQFPFSYISNDAEIALTRLCAERNVGFIAMKALCGGLLTDIGAAHAWIAQFSNVIPIWGIQRESELDALFEVIGQNAPLSGAQKERIAKDRAELGGEFCRACGYCLPCPEGIVINMAARMSQLLRRMPTEQFLTEAWQKEMAKIRNCRHCGECSSRCPYGLDTPALLEKSYQDYRTFLR
jgi:aryl-alcohol dehydrogenase-like predicted oxidoreductase